MSNPPHSPVSVHPVSQLKYMYECLAVLRPCFEIYLSQLFNYNLTLIAFPDTP